MEETTIKLSIRALAANENLSVESLAKKCGIDPVHLRNVSLGRAVMTAKELIRLSEGTGVSPFGIRID
jgi:transcriptional regulator with XRE-family HTH domain